MSECEAHSEADNDVVEDVELIADEESARNVSSTIFDNFQSILLDITCLLTMRLVRYLATFDCIWADFAL